MAPVSFPLLSPGARLLCAALALVATSALAAVLLAGWHHASDPIAAPAPREVRLNDLSSPVGLLQHDHQQVGGLDVRLVAGDGQACASARAC